MPIKKRSERSTITHFRCFYIRIVMRVVFTVLTTFISFLVVECNPQLQSFLEKIATVETAPLPKLIVRNDTRLLFVAGLEGSGHHGMADMFQLCANTAFCKREDVLSAYSVAFDNDLQKSVGLFAGADGPNNHDFMRRMLDRMSALANSTGELPRTLYYLGLSDEKSSIGNLTFDI